MRAATVCPPTRLPHVIEQAAGLTRAQLVVIAKAVGLEPVSAARIPGALLLVHEPVLGLVFTE